MSNDQKIFKVNKIDFGVNIKRVATNQAISSGKPQSKDNFFKKVLNLLKTISKRVAIITKFLTVEGTKIKKNFSRSIFLGRGLYFKYIANLALLLIILFGAFAYLSFDKNDPKGFLSKYSGISKLNSGIYYNTGSSESVIASKELISQHRVAAGDTLSTIAAKYSTPENVITVDTIIWANGLNPNTVLKTGMLLEIPPVSGVLHTVKRGDTVISIAKKYKLIDDKSTEEQVTGATQQIVDINYLSVVATLDSNGNEIKTPEIFEGSKLIIPGGIIEAARPVVRPTNPPSSPSSPVYTQPVIAPGASFVWPVAGGIGYISQGYKTYHKAIDIADRSSPLLVALNSGTVTFAGTRNGLCAIEVSIAYDNGFATMYCHLTVIDPSILNSMRTTKTARVVPGQVVGRMGRTGRATGIHLHMELRYKGVHVNPCGYAPFKGKAGCY
jgi:murein DD-endopeptidase MepM/ murein hydrolase activator NlpD